MNDKKLETLDPFQHNWTLLKRLASKLQVRMLAIAGYSISYSEVSLFEAL